MQARLTVFFVQVIKRPQGDRTEARGDTRWCLLVDAIRLLVITNLVRQGALVVGLRGIRFPFGHLATRLSRQSGEFVLQVQETSRRHGRAVKALHGLCHALLEFVKRLSEYGDCSCRNATRASNLDHHEDSFPWEIWFTPPIWGKDPLF